MENFNSFWEVTAPARENEPALNEDLRVDVAVIGAGFTGLRAALHLAENGSNVIVLDAKYVGHGASGRNGGQVNPMLPVTEPDDLRAAVGDTYFERMVDLSLGSADALFQLIEKHQIRCEARQKGWVRADHSSAARDTSRRNAKLWNQFGAEFEFIDGDDVSKMTGMAGYDSATISPRGGAVQPMALVRGLGDATVRAGARIFSYSPVNLMERKDGLWHLSVNGNRVIADKVIAATNGYTDQLIPGLAASVLPLSPIQIATDPLEDDQIGPILPQGHTVSDTRRLIMYSRREPGGQMVFGGTGFRQALGGIGGFSWVLKDAARLFPSLEGVTWKYRWGGYIALTADKVPHFHEPEPGLIAGLGYNGRGVAMGHAMGKVLADRALGTAPEDLPFPVSTIKGYQFRTPQVLGAGMAMAVMRQQDSWESRRPKT